MSEKTTRVSSDTVFESTATDWVRLSTMTDEEVEQAAACDPDWAAFDEIGDHQKHAGFTLVFGADKKWHWLLRDAAGVVVARGGQGFSRRTDAVRAIDVLRITVANAA